MGIDPTNSSIGSSENKLGSGPFSKNDYVLGLIQEKLQVYQEQLDLMRQNNTTNITNEPIREDPKLMEEFLVLKIDNLRAMLEA